jgi:membrane-associated protease RseP (regulator of RpoE activity)
MQIEILALRHQLAVLQRRTNKRPLRTADRLLWVLLSRVWAEWRSALMIVKPETVIAWQRKGFRLYWRWKSRAGKCGRPCVSRCKIVGTGSAGTAEAIIFKGISFRFPNVKAVNLTVGALPLGFLSSSFGRKVGGVIGNDIIKEFVVEVDYASQTINFYEPQSYQYSGGGEIIPFIIEEKLPFIRASIVIDGRTKIDGKFELDTGSTSSILLNAPFVKKYRLIKSISKTRQIQVGGVGGTGRTLLGRIKNVTIGRFALENLVARFYQGTRGDNASAKYDGLIGGEIFRRFKVIFDYPRRRMILEPDALISESFEIDMSGLELVADGDDFSIVLIDDVEVNSPAAKAGIEGGDIITAIDGRPTVEFTLDQIRKLLMQDGREYLLSLKRGARVMRIKLKLTRSI